MTVKIICDTSADLNLPGDKTIYKEYGIDWVPMQVMFGTDEYKELETLKTSDFYKTLPTVEKHPTTSQATQHDLLKKYEEFGEKFDEIISVHLSSKISGAVANAHMAKKMYEKSNPDGAKIFIYDSLTASLPLGLVTLKAAQLAKKGLKANEILEKLEYWNVNDKLFHFTVGDLKWLFDGGRLSRTKYYLGSLLSKNPILTFVEGALEPLKSGSGLENTFKEILEIQLDIMKEDPKNLTVHFVQAAFQKETEAFAEMTKELYPGINIGKIFTMGGVIASHTGPGTICVVMTRNFEY
ncbi:MAG: DegV family protein [Candidatus Heimdallarchaeaceae archaeon]|jgi:DegV family protein with EDD domain